MFWNIFGVLFDGYRRWLGQSVISPLNASNKPMLEVKTDSDEEKIKNVKIYNLI